MILKVMFSLLIGVLLTGCLDHYKRAFSGALHDMSRDVERRERIQDQYDRDYEEIRYRRSQESTSPDYDYGDGEEPRCISAGNCGSDVGA